MQGVPGEMDRWYVRIVKKCAAFVNHFRTQSRGVAWETRVPPDACVCALPRGSPQPFINVMFRQSGGKGEVLCLFRPGYARVTRHHARRGIASDTQCPPQEMTPCHEEERLKCLHLRDTRKRKEKEGSYGKDTRRIV